MTSASSHAQELVRTNSRVLTKASDQPAEEDASVAPIDTIAFAEGFGVNDHDLLATLQKRNPNITGAGNLGRSSVASNTSTLGGSSVALRGLPTLVLYNGRRLVESPVEAGGGPHFGDLSLFPTALVSRIELLKEGASALYGSDAVGGVVNIFTRDDYQGMEIGARYGFSVESAVAERSAYVIAGTGNETTHVTVGLQYYEIDALFQRERGYSSPPRSLFAGTTTTFAGVGRDALVVTAGGAASNRDYLLIGVNPQDPFGTAGFNSPFDAGVLPGSVAPPPQDPDGPGPRPAPPSPGQFAQLPQAYRVSSSAELQTFNLSLFPTNTRDQNRTSAIGSFTHQFFGKQLEFFGDFLYTHNHNSSALNAQPIGNNTGVIILGSQRVNPEFTTARPFGSILPTGTPNTQLIAENRGQPAPFNPFQLSLDDRTLAGRNRLIVGNRFLPFPRTFTNDTHFYRWLGGLRSQFHENWSAEAVAYFSKYNLGLVSGGLVNLNQLNAMISGTATDLNGNAIPALDFFARNPVGTNPGQVTRAQFQTIFGKALQTLDAFQQVFDARVSGVPLELPGGPLGIVLGAEYRNEGFKVEESPAIFVASVVPSIGSTPIGEINATRSVYALFGETTVPIVGATQDIPFIRSLELNLAGRYDHYEGIREEPLSPRVTLRYQPVEDLTLRGSWSNSFVAPTLYQLYGPQRIEPGVSFNIVTVSGPVLTGSNADLSPSTADAYTAGIIYKPRFAPGLVLTADYFRTLQQGAVGRIGAATIINSVNQHGPASPYAQLVAFNNFPGRPGAQPVTAPGQLIGQLPSVFTIDTNQNTGTARIEGFDLSARYALDMQQWGRLDVGANAVVFTKNDLKSLPDHEYYNISGLNFAELGGANPDYKVTFLFGYRWHGASLSLNAYYLPALRNAVGRSPELEDQNAFMRIEDYISFDGRLSYTFGGEVLEPTFSRESKSTPGPANRADSSAAGAARLLQRLLADTTLTVGCNNLLDEDPRLVAGASSATNLSIYDPFGRFVYFEVSKKF